MSSSMSKETQILHPPFPTISQDNSSSNMYNLRVSGEDADLQVWSMDFLHNKFFYERDFTIKSSQSFVYKPSIYEEIDLEEWKKSLRYSDEQIDNLLRDILADFSIETTPENIDWVKKNVNDLISLYEKKYQLQLESYMRSALEKLAVRMAYDRICLKNAL